MRRKTSNILVPLVLLAASLEAGAAERAVSVEVSGHGPPIVLVPGLGCDGDVWSSTVQRYRDAHEVHVVGIAGFAGQPPAPGRPVLDAAASDLAAYIRERRLERPVVVGHSFGGVVALVIAIDNPGPLGGVVIVDALPFLPAAGDRAVTVESIRPQAEAMRTAIAALSPEAWAAQTRMALAAMITAPEDVERVAARSALSSTASVAQAVFDLMTTDLRSRLANVRTPALILVGAKGGDTARMRSVYRAQYAKLRGNVVRLARGARHFIMLDDAPFFFAALDGFLAKVAP